MHNHPIRCCCETHPDDMLEATGRPYESGSRTIRCASCTEHGDLGGQARCPDCEQLVGRPHIEYCLWATMAPTETVVR